MAKVLIACEYSGRVRDAFLARGHDAVSCDLLPTDSPGPHHQGDVRDILADRWDLVIAHPPCTYLSSSGLHWNTRGVLVDGRPRAELTEEAVEFARMFIDGPETAHIPLRAVENPVGCLSSRVRKPDQIIHPHQFGDDASKSTCLWLVGLPPLVPTKLIPPRIVGGKKRWANQTDSGQNRLGPSEDRWKVRSQTYAGIAGAFAAQWGPVLE
jgi:hypothetical protein